MTRRFISPDDADGPPPALNVVKSSVKHEASTLGGGNLLVVFQPPCQLLLYSFLHSFLIINNVFGNWAERKTETERCRGWKLTWSEGS